MYANRYQPNPINRSSLTASVGIVGGLLTVALLSSPVVRRHLPDGPLTLINVPPAPPPPPIDRPPPPKQTAKVTPRLDQPTQVVPTKVPVEPYVAPPVAGATIDLTPGEGTGTSVIPFDPPKPPTPVRVGSQVDPRYAGYLQPDYPPGERRAGNSGVVTLRVLIGVDGRVRQVERLTAASEDFWRVTERQALGKWRFKPATQDGVPVESWRTMTVRFNLQDDE